MDNKPRIGFIITKAETGGAQRWTLDQICLLKEDIHPFLIAGEDQWLTQTLNTLSPLILPDLLKRLPNPVGLLKLRRYIRDNSISILVASSANAGVYARLMKLFIPRLRVVYLARLVLHLQRRQAVRDIHPGGEAALKPHRPDHQRLPGRRQKMQ